MKRVVLWVCALMMTLIASVGVAGKYSPYFATEPPREVREHVANRWPDYEFEDYCEVRGTPKGDYGFALVHRKNERILVGYHKVDGEMKYWLKNAGELSWPEILQIFNGGIGYVLILPAEQAEEAINRIQAFNLRAWRIGEIARRAQDGEQVVVNF